MARRAGRRVFSGILDRGINTIYNLYGYALILPLLIISTLAVIVSPGLKFRRQLASLALKALFSLWGIRWKIEGVEHLPDSPCIIIGNHTSYLDGPILQMLLPPRVSFAIMEEVQGLPPVHWLLARLGSTFITRTDSRQAAQQTRHMLRKLHEEGQTLGIFAEGRMGKPDSLQRFRRGAFMLATHGGGVPAVPVLIRGPERLLPAGTWRLRPHPLHIRILPPVHPTGSGRSAAETLRDQVYAKLESTLADALRQEGLSTA